MSEHEKIDCFEVWHELSQQRQWEVYKELWDTIERLRTEIESLHVEITDLRDERDDSGREAQSLRAAITRYVRAVEESETNVFEDGTVSLGALALEENRAYLALETIAAEAAIGRF